MGTSWKKFNNSFKVELFHEIMLESNGKWVAKADKNNPLPGIVTHYTFKKIGKNTVEMWYFIPDFDNKLHYTISSKWFRRI